MSILYSHINIKTHEFGNAILTAISENFNIVMCEVTHVI